MRHLCLVPQQVECQVTLNGMKGKIDYIMNCVEPRKNLGSYYYIHTRDFIEIKPGGFSSPMCRTYVIKAFHIFQFCVVRSNFILYF